MIVSLCQLILISSPVWKRFTHMRVAYREQLSFIQSRSRCLTNVGVSTEAKVNESKDSSSIKN